LILKDVDFRGIPPKCHLQTFHSAMKALGYAKAALIAGAGIGAGDNQQSAIRQLQRPGAKHEITFKNHRV
jgi:hypothetical protein